MIEEGKRRYLETFRDELVQAGYEVVNVEPQRRQSTVMRMAGEEDDTVGFVVVRTPVEIGGVVFEGDLVVTVFEDRIAGHGVDIRSTPDDPLSEEKRDHLSSFVPPREVESDGNPETVWTYYPPPSDLPDTVAEGDRDNIAEVVEELSAVFDRIGPFGR